MMDEVHWRSYGIEPPRHAPRCTDGEVKESTKALIDGGAQKDIHTINDDGLGRSLLHLALNSGKPYLMAKAMMASIFIMTESTPIHPSRIR
jgi:hypothetical protein